MSLRSKLSVEIPISLSAAGTVAAIFAGEALLRHGVATDLSQLFAGSLALAIILRAIPWKKEWVSRWASEIMACILFGGALGFLLAGY